MPLNGINQTVLALQSLGNAIVGAAYDPQALAYLLDSLMMERVGIDLLAQDLAQHTVFVHCHLMGGNIAQILRLGMTDGTRYLGRNILVQTAAKGYIQHLEATADSEDRLLLLPGQPDQLKS